MKRWKPVSRTACHALFLAAALTVLTAVLLSGCAAGREPERRLTRARWDTVWQAGGSSLDTVMSSPAILVFNRGTLFVLDRATPRVVAFDAATGAFRWKAGRRGGGPGEFAGVSAMFPDPAGGIGVVDIRNRRVSTLTPIGAFGQSLPTASLGQQPNQVCPFGEDRLLVADVWDPSLLEADTAGSIVQRRAPLWEDLAGGDWQSHQVTLRSDGTGRRCLVALSTGRGFAVLSPDEAPVFGQYVEDFEVYRVGARANEGEVAFWATYDAAFVGDTILMLFSGRTPERDRLIDRYDARSGAYLSSDLLPFSTKGFATGDGLLYVLDTAETGIVALRARRQGR